MLKQKDRARSMLWRGIVNWFTNASTVVGYLFISSGCCSGVMHIPAAATRYRRSQSTIRSIEMGDT
jgi:hypothetical protein